MTLARPKRSTARPGRPAVGRTRSFAVAAAGVTLVALFVALWLSDQLPKSHLPPGFVDAGAVTDLGLPFSRVIVDTSALGTVGMLVTSILVPRTDGRLGDTARRCVRTAAWLSLVWAVATVAYAYFEWSDILAVPVWRLDGPQLFSDHAFSFPESVKFLTGAALAVVIAVLAGFTRHRWGAVVLTAVSLYNLLPFTTTGHASHSPLIAYFLTVHVIALSLWVGGLAGLLIHVRGSVPLLAVAVPRFSTLALFCYVAVAASGVVMALINLGSPGELWHSRYGLLVLFLATAQLVLGIFGAWHRRYTVRAVREQRSSGAFVRLAAAEVVIMAAAVAFGVVLSRTETPDTSAASTLVRPDVVVTAQADAVTGPPPSSGV